MPSGAFPAGYGGAVRVRPVGAVVIGAALSTAACSGGSDDAATSNPTSVTSTTLDGTFTSDDPVTEDGPVATTVVPPSTDLIGDPQPGPSSTRAPSPTTEPDPDAPPPPDVCEQLEAFGVSDVVAQRAAADSASIEAVAPSVCRVSAGGIAVEVHVVPLGDVVEDWFNRSGIQPAGPSVGGEAVGLASFITPTGDSAAGYTIATVGDVDGVVVAVAAPADAKALAVDIAVFAQQIA